MRKAVITAAGLGTRLLPSSKEIPKEMFPIFDVGKNGILCVKPVMHKIFENLYDTGFRNFCIIVGRGKRSIEDHFTPDQLFSNIIGGKIRPEIREEILNFYEKITNSKIFFINQPSPRGFGDAVLQAEEFVGNEYFLLHAGDDLVLSNDNSHLRRLLEVFEEFHAEIIILSERVNDPTQYGVISGDMVDEGRGIVKIRDIVEKPSKPPSNIAVIGAYILSPKIFKALKNIKEDSRGEMQLTEGLREILKDGGEAYSILLRSDEKRLDVGNPENYYRALIESYTFCKNLIKNPKKVHGVSYKEKLMSS
ncbi:MAG: sugar phosphate nucleotidyltransferase [Candidatus Bathyarchaeia archaeon]